MFFNVLAFFALYLITVSLDFLVNFFVNLLNISNNLAIIIIGIIAGCSVLLIIHFRDKINVDIMVEVLKLDHQKREAAQKGLVLILPRFVPHNDLALFKKNNPDEYNNALENLDYEKLMIDDVSQSNFGHSVTALKSHKSKLEHVWLICSKSLSGITSQSIDHAPLLEKYIKEKISDKINVHYGDEYTVLLDDDSSVCRNSFNLVKNLYNDA